MSGYVLAMRYRKEYGRSREDGCPFCGKRATVENDDGLLVCHAHKNESLPLIRCACGDILDQKAGKFGPYFSCFQCGNISFSKAMELKAMQVPKKLVKPGIYDNGEYIPSIDEL